MPRLGVAECNRCRLLQIQDEAQEKGMVLTKRRSAYGGMRKHELKPKVAGIDIYMHPKSVDIPSNFVLYHDGNLATMEAMAELLPDDDPEKWFVAWFPAIPDRCVCKAI